MKSREVRKQNRSFGILFVIVFGLIAAYGFFYHFPVFYLFVGLGAVFLALTVFAPNALELFNALWLSFGALLHRVISPVIVAAIFYLILSPYGIVLRLLGKDPLSRTLCPRQGSYWINREAPISRGGFKDQF